MPRVNKRPHRVFCLAYGKIFKMFLAPDLIYAETGNILWKKRRKKELTRFQLEEITDHG